MIQIHERIAERVSGETSLFVSFSYKEEYVNIVKGFSGSSYHKKKKEWEIPLPYLSKLLDSFCLYDSIEVNLLDEKEECNIEDVSLSFDEFKYKPYEYQSDGIKFGLTHDNWLLLYDMGLGKTAVIIYLASELKKEGKIDHCLIVCGVNSLKNNWKKEIKKFSDLSCTILGERLTKRGNLVVGSIKERIEHLRKPIDEFFVITNIETLRNEEIVNELSNGINKFDMIAVDEIHRCSSDPSSQQSVGLLKLTNAKYKIGATGTLITNNPLNAYVPLRWVEAERGTFTNFKGLYCVFFKNIITGYKNINYLHEIIDKNSLRRTKDILGLPEKTIINEYVDMKNDQELFYENIKNGIRDQVDKVVLNTSNLLAMVSRLRQATACPSVLTTEKISSAKEDRAVDLVEQIVESGDKVVIFSTFKETVYNLAERLKKYDPLVCTGDYSDSEISNNVDVFQTDESKKAFIATWQKCGTGFTLTASRYMIFVDIPFTNSSYTQAQDRIYRIGTTKPVFIYHLITNNTIDERVLEIVEDKEALGNYIVDGEISSGVLNKLRSFIEEL